MLSLNTLIPFPSGFWTGSDQLGIDAEKIIQKGRLPFSLITQQAVTIAQYYTIWQTYSDLVGDTAKGIVNLASAFETAKFPPTVLATYHAGNYREALNLMVRYKQMCPPDTMRMVEEGELCTIDLEWSQRDHAGPAILTGITLAFLLELGRRGTRRPLTARSIEFTQSMGDVKVLEDYFGCRVRTNSSFNRMVLHRRDLERSFVSNNAELMEILTPVLDKTLEKQLGSRSVAETVKRIIKHNLAEGNPSIHAIAKELGMSDRSLQRRLAEENTSFKLLLAQGKQEQARAYLADPSLQVKEVAYLVGYKDQNSFYRAFRQWEGETPFNWRSAQMIQNR